MWLLTLVTSTLGANLAVRLEPPVIGQEDTASLVFEVTREDGIPVGQAQFEALECSVLSEAQSESFQLSIVNGARTASRRTSVTFILSPRKQGRLKIENIRMKVGNDLLRAQDLFLEVKPGAMAPHPSQAQGLRRFFGAGPSAPAPGFLQLIAEASRQELFEGESADVSYVLYHQYPLQHIEARALPKFEGALKEELISITQRRALPPPTQVLYQGRSVLRSELAKWRVTPLQVGTLEIEPLKIFTISTTPPDPDDLFASFLGGGGMQQKQLESPIIPLIVQALPKENSEHFSGVIGTLQGSVAFKKQTVKVGEPLSLEMRLKGEVARLRPPVLPSPVLDGLAKDWQSVAQVFDPRLSAVKDGTRTIEWILIPRKKGLLEVGPFSIKVFDPETKDYRLVSFPSVSVQMEGAGLVEDEPVLTGVVEDPTQKPTLTLLAPEERFASRAWWWSSVLLSVFVLFMLAAQFFALFKAWARARVLSGNTKEQTEIRLKREVEQFLSQKSHASPQGVALLKKMRPLASVDLREEIDAILFDAGSLDTERIKKTSKAWLQMRMNAKSQK